MQSKSQESLCVVGLGYVGLPLALAFSKVYSVVGFDLDGEKVAQLRAGLDYTGELNNEELVELSRVKFTADSLALENCSIFIVAVPTPIDSAFKPDLSALIAASGTVSRFLKRGDVVVYESTVFPGCTEEICLPILLDGSGLLPSDFTLGYSPERINPGDPCRRLKNITKIVSGRHRNETQKIAGIYGKIIEAGVYEVNGLKVAEAAKVIENTQRDVNIALVNELALIFERLDIDTKAVLDAAGSKWNFARFSPGLVGGHCIGVDPYYLTHKAIAVGYFPEVILAGRRVNNGMGIHIAQRLVKRLFANSDQASNRRILILGFTFKENCPDVRNTRVVDIIDELVSFGLKVEIYDPLARISDVESEYGKRYSDMFLSFNPLNQPEGSAVSDCLYSGVVVAVAHDEFRATPPGHFRGSLAEGGVLFDVKAILPIEFSDLRL